VRRGVAQLNDADGLLGRRGKTPSGTLRISAMPSCGLGRDQVDIAIRGGHLPQERAVARKLDPNRLVLAASPQYLRTMGTP
jgi:hypothetical protein